MKDNEKIKDMSVHEASDFWDEHNFDEFEDVQEVKNLGFSLKKKYVGIDKNLFNIIKNKAEALNTSEDTLINEWLLEKVSA